MSEEASAWAWAQDVSGVEKLVLLAVAGGATSRGVCVETQLDLSAKTGVNETTVRRNLKRLGEGELLHREPRYSRSSGGREADAIVLHMPPDGDRAERPVTPRAEEPVTPRAERPASVRDPQLTTTSPSSSAGGEPVLPEALIADANELWRQGRKVDGKKVTELEMLIAAHAVAEFNDQLKSDYGLGASLTSVVMRIRDRPGWDAAKHRRLVQSAFRIRWWEQNGKGRRPSLNVVYGERVFEQVIQDAKDEAAGREPEARARRGREV